MEVSNIVIKGIAKLLKLIKSY